MKTNIIYDSMVVSEPCFGGYDDGLKQPLLSDLTSAQGPI